jgi:hypothetical protein
MAAPHANASVKNFTPPDSARGYAIAKRVVPGNKSFLVLFFKKEPLAFPSGAFPFA